MVPAILPQLRQSQAILILMLSLSLAGTSSLFRIMATINQCSLILMRAHSSAALLRLQMGVVRHLCFVMIIWAQPLLLLLMVVELRALLNRGAIIYPLMAPQVLPLHRYLKMELVLIRQ